jgi:hypothetical protein
MSVDKIHGINAEKKRIADTETTPTTYFITIDALATNSAGKNISAIRD